MIDHVIDAYERGGIRISALAETAKLAERTVRLALQRKRQPLLRNATKIVDAFTKLYGPISALEKR